jgi:F-type H+-transporting ATPase subunit alpha
LAGQIAVLLALTERLFDPIPLVGMDAAEKAVLAAAARIPADLRERFTSAATLGDKDRQALITLIKEALADLPPEPAP